MPVIHGSTEGGKPVVGTVEVETLPAARVRAANSWLLQIRIQLKDADENGMPTPAERQLVDRFQDQILALVAARTTPFTVGYLDGDGLRVVYVYLPESQSAHRDLVNVVRSEPIREFDYRIVHDPDWEIVGEWLPESEQPDTSE